MSDKKLHKSESQEVHMDFFSKGSLKWEKSEAEVWAEMETKMSEKPVMKRMDLMFKYAQYAAAAVLFLLVGLFGVVSTYTKSVESLPGEHVFVQLPDGSNVDLNAGSGLKYYPLKWKFERKLKLEGEAFFSVTKGKNFKVISPNGSTEVLGTSFNIYARDNNYRVSCLTGKVKVSTANEESVVLTPNFHVELEKGKLIVKEMFDKDNVAAWRNNQFYFAGRPLKEVIDEIERQYAVTIRLQPELEKRSFAINFSKKHSVEEVLNFVCKVMQVKFEKQSENVFLVREKS